MKSLTKWILVAMVTVSAGCFSGKQGPRGTNINTNDDPDAPRWERGHGDTGTAAATTPR